MSEKRFKKMDTIIDPFPIWDTVEEKGLNCTDTLDVLVDLLNELVKDNEELGISIKLFEDDVATKDKKIDEQQDTIRKLRNENIILKNKIEDLRVSLFMQGQVLQRQMQKSDLDE